jgi:CRP-like cAMP-binding protein
MAQEILTDQHPILHEFQSKGSELTTGEQKRLFFEVGDPAIGSLDLHRYFYFIIDGKIKLSQINFETSKEQILYLLGKGDMFDVVTLLDGSDHEFLSEVLEPTTLVEVPIAHVRTLLDSDQEFKRIFFPYIAKQLRGMEDLAVDLSLYSVYERLVRLFARYIDNYSKTPTLQHVNNLTHDDLASMVGSVRKVVNRALQQLKESGIIEISRKQIRLKDIKKLLDKLSF